MGGYCHRNLTAKRFFDKNVQNLASFAPTLSFGSRDIQITLVMHHDRAGASREDERRRGRFGRRIWQRFHRSLMMLSRSMRRKIH